LLSELLLAMWQCRTAPTSTPLLKVSTDDGDVGVPHSTPPLKVNTDDGCVEYVPVARRRRRWRCQRNPFTTYPSDRSSGTFRSPKWDLPIAQVGHPDRPSGTPRSLKVGPSDR
jgi:hypothetical protein